MVRGGREGEYEGDRGRRNTAEVGSPAGAAGQRAEDRKREARARARAREGERCDDLLAGERIPWC